MITNVSLATVWVNDQDESKAFYIDVLGFEESADISMGDGYRWVAVRHPDHPELQITLMTPGPPLDADSALAFQRMLDKGAMPGLGMAVDDCRKTFEELTAKDVVFLQEPAERPYGVEAVMRDNAGNWLVLVQPRDFEPSDFTPEATH